MKYVLLLRKEVQSHLHMASSFIAISDILSPMKKPTSINKVFHKAMRKTAMNEEDFLLCTIFYGLNSTLGIQL